MEIVSYIWMAIMITAIIVEISTVDLTSMWFAIGAFGALILSFFAPKALVWQVTLFVILSSVALIVLRPLFKKKLDTPIIATNADSLIGKLVVVESEIKPNFPGSVKAEGIEWTAVSDESFNPGDLVVIQSIKGNTLTVIKNNKKED